MIEGGVGSLSCGSVRGVLGGWLPGTPGAGGACWRKVCVSTFCLGCDRTHAVCFAFLAYDLVLHAVFAEDVGKHLMVFCFLLTQI